MSLARSSSARSDASERSEGVFPLLDLAFGFFVWAGHFLAVYVGAAVVCVLAPKAPQAEGRMLFVTALTLITIAATAIVVAHAVLRYRRLRGLESAFRLAVTIGCDAIAALAIVLQMIPVGVVPACA